jgi:hypothetical protein
MRKRVSVLLLVILLTLFLASIKTTVLAQTSERNFALKTQRASQENDAEVQALISQLYHYDWRGVEIILPKIAHHLTPPMKKILEIGAPAQHRLLEKLPDPRIKDQILYLLGGIGDESIISPIIEAMLDEDHINTIANAKHINRIANFALTNITAADVAFRKTKGRDVVLNCSEEKSKSCWGQWWEKNRNTFAVKTLTSEDRSFTLYPNYGIYRMLQYDNVVFIDFDAKDHMFIVK